MLSNYDFIEPVICRQLKNDLNNLPHAYLFNLNKNVYAESIIMAFISSIICSSHDNLNEYNSCEICRKIKDDSCEDLVKIYPDGLFIKKNQIDSLQDNYKKKSAAGNNRVYIIYDADKLNKSAANSLLKFLEEPASGVIAILLTNNINQMMDTIKSRCRLISFKRSNANDYINYNNIRENITLNKIKFDIFKNYDNEDLSYYLNFIDGVIDFIDCYEKNGLKTIIYLNDIASSFTKSKDELLYFFECLIFFYRDVINYKLGLDIKYFEDYIDFIEKMVKLNTVDELIKKINVIIECSKYVKYNANINLLVDRLIIDMEE